jgi:hypothetical protein
MGGEALAIVEEDMTKKGRPRRRGVEYERKRKKIIFPDRWVP